MHQGLKMEKIFNIVAIIFYSITKVCFSFTFFQYPNYQVAVYQVSGEYAMLWHGSTCGAFDLKTVLMETLTSMRRAGKTFKIRLTEVSRTVV